MDILRGWNERSFLGWKHWWTRIAATGLIGSALQALWSTTPFSAYLATFWILSVAALILAIGRIMSWLAGLPPKATVSGLLRFAPIVWLVPVLDAALLPLFSRPDGSILWVAPSSFLSRFYLAGCEASACLSPGLSLFSLMLAAFVGFVLVRLGLKYGKAIGGAALVYVLFWMAISVPAFTAWTRLSTYGATLASPNQVVEQAFNRTWASSTWLATKQQFWTLPTIGNQGSRMLVGSILLWLLCFGLFAPILRRPVITKAAWLERLHKGALVLPPLLLGALLGFTSRPAWAWVTALIGGVFLLSLTIVAWRAIIALDQDEIDQDQGTFVLILALLGAWLLGWPTFCAFALALVIRAWGQNEAWLGRVFALAASAWFLVIAGWTWFARADWAVLPRGLLLGVFALLLGLAWWQGTGYALAEGGGMGRLFGLKGPVVDKKWLWGGVVAGILLFWLASASLGLAWAAGALLVVSAAIVWLFPLNVRNIALFVWFSCVLIGIVLPSLR